VDRAKLQFALLRRLLFGLDCDGPDIKNARIGLGRIRNQTRRSPDSRKSLIGSRPKPHQFKDRSRRGQLMAIREDL